MAFCLQSRSDEADPEAWKEGDGFPVDGQLRAVDPPACDRKRGKGADA